MKKTLAAKIIAWILCVVMIAAAAPVAAVAEETPAPVVMTEGDVIPGFAPDGAEYYFSTDPSVAWIDGSGSLNAMKPGAVTVSALTEDGWIDRDVTVTDYDDGSPVVGNLKLLVRYNDSMQFYDGHVYLLFTSYQDGVVLTFDDLYAGYEIYDNYYADMAEDISFGSNHTGNDADAYFSLRDGEELSEVILDRGEIVTIGMYRGFDLSVAQAALGCVTNSSAWAGLKDAAKSAVIRLIFDFLDNKGIRADEALEKFKALGSAEGFDFTRLLDGTVEGGVCLNRELYNQKLEWDQYENVTYELDVTANQLEALNRSLEGNLNNFSILKNSCATVALRAWNAAVGTRDGLPTSYMLDPTGEGIFSIIDAPKNVRDAVVDRLPGYYLNNSEGVEEPDAGYQDETGWVYVSAPEKVSPLTFVYSGDEFRVDGENSSMADLIVEAKKACSDPIFYSAGEQQVGVEVKAEKHEGLTEITEVEFLINGVTARLDADSQLPDGIWFKVKVDPPVEGDLYAVDPEGNALPGEYSDGWLSFYAESLPVSFGTAVEEAPSNVLVPQIFNGDEVAAETQVYIKRDGQPVYLGFSEETELEPGVPIYVRAELSEDDWTHVLTDVDLDGGSIMDEAHYDADEGAYVAYMGEGYCFLNVTYEEGEVYADAMLTQAAVGDELSASDLAQLLIGGFDADPDRLRFYIPDGDDSPAGYVDGTDCRRIALTREGGASLWIHDVTNVNVGAFVAIEIRDTLDGLVAVTFNDDKHYGLFAEDEYGGEDRIPFSGYLVEPGTVIRVVPENTAGTVVSGVTANLIPVRPGATITVRRPTDVKVSFRSAEIKGLPSNIALAGEDDSCQLGAAVRYTGVFSILPVYDRSIRYESSDPLVEVDESGLVTVAGEIPENGKAVYVTAYAGSSGDTVFARCKVVVGDYDGARTVGKLTVWARRIDKGQLIAHSALNFTPYEDVDLNVSYYHYYRPTEKLFSLIREYNNDPGAFASDPLLYSDDELGLEDRESYFEELGGEAYSEPKTVSILKDNSITISNYGYEISNLLTILKAFEGGMIGFSPNVQELAQQIRAYLDGGEVDGSAAFDSMISTLTQTYMAARLFGFNPADGVSEGGLDINREAYNQFRRDDSQLPNNCYTVEITADEFAVFAAYLADPDNNYYSLFTKNCASGTVDLWNATLSDRPELALNGNYTGFGVDPESLYFELGLLRTKAGLDGEGGCDFYPRILVNTGFRFVDVPDDAWYTGGVYYCYENGFMTGTSATEFSPSGAFTRAMFVTVLARIDGADLSDYDGTHFSDVEEGKWYSRAVEWAYLNKYTSGLGGGRFAPDAAVTRETLAQFLYTYTRLKGGDVSTTGDLSEFNDADSVSRWALQAVRWAVENGLISGTGNGSLSPKTTATRAQVAVIVARYVKNVK